jgi:HK97 family phage prohead protease
MQHSNFPFEVKSVSESGDGSFVGFASTYHNIDRQGDSVQPGAFSKTLKDSQHPFPLLASHDPREQVGFAKFEDTTAGLVVHGQLVLHSERAKQTYALMKAKALRGLSIGYDTIRSTMKDNVRLLTELKLWEVSITAFPANELALVQSVKTSNDPVGEFRRVMLLCARQIRGE